MLRAIRVSGSRRLQITLMEILIVITLFAILAGFISYNIQRAVREQRFHSEVGHVVDALGMAQDLMLLLDVNVALKFTRADGEEGIRYWLEPDVDLPKQWSRELLRQRPNLHTIHFVEFKDGLQHDQDEGYLELRFFSGGLVMSRGVLRLSTASTDDETAAHTRYICLPGYPKPIFSQAAYEETSACSATQESDKALIEYTKEELAEMTGKTNNVQNPQEAPNTP